MPEEDDAECLPVDTFGEVVLGEAGGAKKQ